MPWLTFLASGLVYLRMVIHPCGIVRISPGSSDPELPLRTDAAPESTTPLPFRTQDRPDNISLETDWIPAFRR